MLNYRGKGVCVWGGGGVLNYLMDFCFSLECYDVKIDNRMLRTDNKYITLNIKCLKWKKKISWLKKITYIQRWSKETKPIRGVWQFNFNTCISIRGLLEKFVDKVIYGKITVYRMKYVLWTDYQMKKKKSAKNHTNFFTLYFFFPKD